MDGLRGRRVGILGGTFDPVHIGHLVMAAEARQSLRLDEIVFMPARTPPHKPDHTPAPVEARLSMLAGASGSEPCTTISRIDLDRPGPHYTVEMLAIARAAWRLGAADELWFVMGGDSLEDLPGWRRPEEIVRLARLAVIDRPGHSSDPALLEAVLPGVGDRVDHVVAPLIGVSGTDIRRRVAEGRTIRWHVPPAVESYILAHRLYRDGPAA